MIEGNNDNAALICFLQTYDHYLLMDGLRARYIDGSVSCLYTSING